MALFMDMHAMDGPVTVDDVAKAHAADLQTQEGYDVRYLRYWVDESHGKIFCLVDAPDADAAAAVHRAAHGLVADEIYPVTEGALHPRPARSRGGPCLCGNHNRTAPPALPHSPAIRKRPSATIRAMPPTSTESIWSPSPVAVA
jgi:hypothetical protein